MLPTRSCRSAFPLTMTQNSRQVTQVRGDGNIQQVGIIGRNSRGRIIGERDIRRVEIMVTIGLSNRGRDPGDIAQPVNRMRIRNENNHIMASLKHLFIIYYENQARKEPLRATSNPP